MHFTSLACNCKEPMKTGGLKPVIYLKLTFKSQSNLCEVTAISSLTWQRTSWDQKVASLKKSVVLSLCAGVTPLQRVDFKQPCNRMSCANNSDLTISKEVEHLAAKSRSRYFTEKFVQNETVSANPGLKIQLSEWQLTGSSCCLVSAGCVT